MRRCPNELARYCGSGRRSRRNDGGHCRRTAGGRRDADRAQPEGGPEAVYHGERPVQRDQPLLPRGGPGGGAPERQVPVQRPGAYAPSLGGGVF